MGIGFDTCMKNPHWRALYDNAPSDEVKEYYQIMFDVSSFVTEEDYDTTAEDERLKEIMLTREDAEYILEHAGIIQAKIHFSKIIEQFFGEYEADTVSASLFKGEIYNPWYESNME